MDELLQLIRAESVSVWRFRWWAMLTAWSICLLGFVGVSLWPNQYEASAAVFVDASSRLDEVIGGVAIEWDMGEQLNRVRQEMLSRPVLEAVAREMDLDLAVTTPAAMSELVESLRQRIRILEERRRMPDPRMPTDVVLTITYRDKDRQTALAVVQTLLDTFVSDVIRGGQGASEVARSFLLERIASYEETLEAREDALAQFKRDNLGLLPGTEGDYFMRLQSAIDELDRSEAELRAAENQRDALRAQLGTSDPAVVVQIPSANGAAATQPGPLDALQSRIDDLEDQLADYLLRFTEQHPDVIATRQQLERLYAQRQSDLAALTAAAGSEFEGSALSSNPVYQSIQIALNESKVEIARLESEVVEQRRRVEDLKEKINVIPDIEARLAGLTRDYDQVKQIHDQLVSRLEQERLGTAAVYDDVNFTVIEPPSAPFTPTSPQRLIILAALFVVAIGGGGGLAYVMNMLKPVFSNSKALRDYTELPVLGSVTATRSGAQRLVAKLSLVGFVALGALLVVVYAVLVTVREDAAQLARSLLG